MTDFATDMVARAEAPLLWPLLIGAWKRKTHPGRS